MNNSNYRILAESSSRQLIDSNLEMDSDSFDDWMEENIGFARFTENRKLNVSREDEEWTIDCEDRTWRMSTSFTDDEGAVRVSGDVLYEATGETGDLVLVGQFDDGGRVKTKFSFGRDKLSVIETATYNNMISYYVGDYVKI